MRLLPRFVAPALMIALAALPILGSFSGCSNDPSPKAVVLPLDELPDLHRAGLTQVWQRRLNVAPDESVRKVWRVGTSIYVSTSDARLARIDARTGTTKWVQGLGAENFNIYRPIELKNPDGGPSLQVLVVTGGEVFTFDLETGDEVRAPQRLGLSVSTEPVVVGNTLCVGGAGMFYGLYLDSPSLRRWVVPSRGNAFVAPPIAVDNNVLFANHLGQLWRISADTGDWDWKDRKTNGPVVAGLVADFNALYVPSLDQRVYAFRADTGGSLWDTQLAGRLETTPVLAGPVLVVKSDTNGIYGLARTNGEIKWQASDVLQVATGTANEVWVSDTGGNLKALDVNDGDVLSSAPAPGIQMVVPNTVDSTVILLTRGNLLGVYSSGRTAAPKPSALDEPSPEVTVESAETKKDEPATPASP